LPEEDPSRPHRRYVRQYGQRLQQYVEKIRIDFDWFAIFDHHFPFAFWCLKTVIRDWIDETVRFNFLAMSRRVIPETMSLRN
jgi:hypothetical protein